MIGRREIATMKDGAILANCAREKFVDQEAVVVAVKGGKLFGYGVETDIMEPIPRDYFSHPRIMATPHTAFFTQEAEQRVSEMAVENVEAFLAGEPKRVVTK